jgi:pimeloyl-ACP methyl ester carboxylesterase
MTNDILSMAKLARAAYSNTLITRDGFTPLDNFGLAGQSASGASVKWTFDQGVYKATVPGKIAALFDDRAVANVYLRTEANGDKTLAIAFRGTDGFSVDKVLGWGPQMENAYYPLYKPFIDAVKKYAATNGVDKVLVTGHSLGAAMTQYAMQDLANTATTKYVAAAFGSPGAVDSGNDPEDRMLEFAYSQDIFTKLKDAPFVSFDHQGQRIVMPLDSATTNNDNITSRYEHSMNLYLKAMHNFASLGTEMPAFMRNDTFNGNQQSRIYAGSTSADDLRGESGKSEALYGGGGNDRLKGLSGNDHVSGGDGNDRLYGNAGNDRLKGGEGSDKFVFDSLLITGNVDTISDFSVADDAIWLDNAIFTKLALGTLNAGRFVIAAQAQDSTDRIIYNDANGNLSYDIDGAGGNTGKLIAKLDIGLTMTSADFWVV